MELDQEPTPQEVTHLGVLLVVWRTDATEYTGEVGTVDVALDGHTRSARIDCEGPAVSFGSVREARVNWPSLGAMPAEAATRFAAALHYASTVLLPGLAPSGAAAAVQAAATPPAAR